MWSEKRVLHTYKMQFGWFFFFLKEKKSTFRFKHFYSLNVIMLLTLKRILQTHLRDEEIILPYFIV